MCAEGGQGWAVSARPGFGLSVLSCGEASPLCVVCLVWLFWSAAIPSPLSLFRLLRDACERRAKPETAAKESPHSKRAKPGQKERAAKESPHERSDRTDAATCGPLTPPAPV